MDVLQRVAADGLSAWRPRARLTHPDHQHLGVQRLESMDALEVGFQRADELLLDVQNAATQLAHGVVMVAGRELVVGRSVAEVRGINGTGSRQCFERSVRSE